ncbi:unnamed protein product [Rhizoctonia solani]|uniref:Uncharacterized protein n=1 Tax=Rhizoctonia solani TaxID=456999 RepID=A0A8H3HQ89_9AGAM|nr:unnamed protein product [Rhizoctonia solani]
MGPEDLSRLLPSVKHLALSSFIWESVVKSNIASRLESLGISDLEFLDDGNPLDPLANAIDEDGLPNLRKLEIWARPGNTELRNEILERILTATKGLEVLYFETYVDNL